MRGTLAAVAVVAAWPAKRNFHTPDPHTRTRTIGPTSLRTKRSDAPPTEQHTHWSPAETDGPPTRGGQVAPAMCRAHTTTHHVQQPSPTHHSVRAHMHRTKPSAPLTRRPDVLARRSRAWCACLMASVACLYARTRPHVTEVRHAMPCHRRHAVSPPCYRMLLPALARGDVAIARAPLVPDAHSHARLWRMLSMLARV